MFLGSFCMPAQSGRLITGEKEVRSNGIRKYGSTTVYFTLERQLSER